jgi:hypothetical protein
MLSLQDTRAWTIYCLDHRQTMPFDGWKALPDEVKLKYRLRTNELMLKGLSPHRHP